MSKYLGYAAICKVDENDDGTVTVQGIASDGSVDLAGEVVTPDAMRAALPDFMKAGTGALREMHQPLAAGTVTEAFVNDGGQTIITARVVDPVAVLKVREGVYKGFSIGGSSTGRSGKTITGLRLTEISLVDAPCNPNAVIQVWKADSAEENMSQEQAVEALAEMVNKGEISATDLLALAKSQTATQEPETQPEAQPETVPEVAKTDEPETVAKGMYTVSDFADVLRDIFWMAADAQDESDWEGDNSPLPAALRDWLKAGVVIFNDMAAEESAELIAELEKAKANKDIGKAAVAEPVTVIATVEVIPEITKALSDVQDVIKSLQQSNQDLVAKHESLQSDHADLLEKFNALPTQPKGVTVVTSVAVAKGDETSLALQSGAAEQEVDPVRKRDGSIDEAATELKKLYRTGGVPLHK